MLHVTLRVYHPLFSPLFTLHFVILSVSRLNRFTRSRQLSPAPPTPVSRPSLALLLYVLPSALLNHHQVGGAAIVLLSMLLTVLELYRMSSYWISNYSDGAKIRDIRVTNERNAIVRIAERQSEFLEARYLPPNLPTSAFYLAASGSLLGFLSFRNSASKLVTAGSSSTGRACNTETVNSSIISLTRVSIAPNYRIRKIFLIASTDFNKLWICYGTKQ